MGKVNYEKGWKLLFLLHGNTMCHLQYLIIMKLILCFQTLEWDIICNQFLDGWMVVQAKSYYWKNYSRFGRTFVNTLHDTYHHKFFTKPKYFQINTRRDEFWDICANFQHMVG